MSGRSTEVVQGQAPPSQGDRQMRLSVAEEGSGPMSTGTRWRLERLRADLIELGDADGKPCGFGLITILGQSEVRLPNGTAWKFLERLANFDHPDGNIRLRPNPWFDPAPGGGSCVRWWGDHERIARFQEWAVRASVVLRKEPDFDVGTNVGPGYHGVLLAFVRLAKGNSELSVSIRTTKLCDTSALSAESRRALPLSLRSLATPATFSFDVVDCRAEDFVLSILDRLLAGSGRGPRLVVDVEQGSVTLDRQTTWPGDVFVNILHELLDARGRPVSRKEMRKNKALEFNERLERDIKKLKTNLKIDIKSSNRGYWLPAEYWQSPPPNLDRSGSEIA